MNCDVLIVSTMEGAVQCAQAIGEQMNVRVEVAVNPREALTALRQREFGVVVVEENMVEMDPVLGDQIWTLAGLALPLQINLHALAVPAWCAKSKPPCIGAMANTYWLVAQQLPSWRRSLRHR